MGRGYTEISGSLKATLILFLCIHVSLYTLVSDIAILALLESLTISLSININFHSLTNLSIPIFLWMFLCLLNKLSGFLGAYLEDVPLLKYFIIAQVTTIILETVFICLLAIMKSNIVRFIVNTYLSAGVKMYLDKDGSEATSVMNFLQEKLECCGSKSYEDYLENAYFNCEPQSFCGPPTSCCKPHVRERNDFCANNAFNSTKEHLETVINMRGCTEIIIKIFEDYLMIVLGIMALIVGFEIVLTCLSKLYMEQVRKHYRMILEALLLSYYRKHGK